jgi:hypothetical protein
MTDADFSILFRKIRDVRAASGVGSSGAHVAGRRHVMDGPCRSSIVRHAIAPPPTAIIWPDQRHVRASEPGETPRRRDEAWACASR